MTRKMTREMTRETAREMVAPHDALGRPLTRGRPTCPRKRAHRVRPINKTSHVPNSTWECRIRAEPPGLTKPV
jgi:hypothetical protein|eukprot:2011749-Prymnesium_polylepis.1